MQSKGTSRSLSFLITTAIFVASLFTFVYQPGAIQDWDKQLLDGGYDQLSILFNYHRLSENLLNLSFPLFDGKMVYPTTDNLLYSDVMPLSGLVYRLLYSFIGKKILTFNLLQLLFLSLNFSVMVWFARKLFSLPISVALACYFTFSQIRITQIDHPHCMPQFFFPLVAGFILDFERGSSRALWGAAIAWGLQFYCSMTLGIILSVTLLPYLVYRCLFKPHRNIYFKPLLKMSLLALLVAGPLLLAYFSVVIRHGYSRSIPDSTAYSANLKSLFLVHGRHPYSSWLVEGLLGGERGARGEKCLFIGFAGMILMFLGIKFLNYKIPREPRKLFYATLVFVILVAMGRNSGMYQLLYYTFPLIRGLRTPGKFSMSYLFLMSILAGYGLNYIRSLKLSSLQKKVILSGLFVLAVFDNRISLYSTTVPRPLDGLLSFLKQTEKHEPVLFIPFAHNGGQDDVLELSRMYLMLDQHHPMGNGSVGFSAPSKRRFRELGLDLLDSGVTAENLSLIQTMGIRYLIVERERLTPDLLVPLLKALESRVVEVFSDSQVTVFDLKSLS